MPYNNVAARDFARANSNKMAGSQYYHYFSTETVNGKQVSVRHNVDCAHFGSMAVRDGIGAPFAMKKKLTAEDLKKGHQDTPHKDPRFWFDQDGALPRSKELEEFLTDPTMLDCSENHTWTPSQLPRTPADVKQWVPHVRPGDIAFWWVDLPGGGRKNHHTIVIDSIDNDNIYYDAHSNDRRTAELLNAVRGMRTKYGERYTLRIVHVGDQNNKIRNCMRPFYYWTSDSTFAVEWRPWHYWYCCWHENLGGTWPWSDNPSAYACLSWAETNGTTWDTLILPRVNLVGCSAAVLRQERYSNLLHGPNRTIEVRGSTNGGITWPYLLGDDSIEEVAIDWANGQRNVRLAWIYHGPIQAGRFWCIDDIEILAKPTRSRDTCVSEVSGANGCHNIQPVVSPGATESPAPLRPLTHVR
jgi:hypothetical protein